MRSARSLVFFILGKSSCKIYFAMYSKVSYIILHIQSTFKQQLIQISMTFFVYFDYLIT